MPSRSLEEAALQHIGSRDVYNGTFRPYGEGSRHYRDRRSRPDRRQARAHRARSNSGWAKKCRVPRTLPTTETCIAAPYRNRDLRRGTPLYLVGEELGEHLFDLRRRFTRGLHGSGEREGETSVGKHAHRPLQPFITPDVDVDLVAGIDVIDALFGAGCCAATWAETGTANHGEQRQRKSDTLHDMKLPFRALAPLQLRMTSAALMRLMSMAGQSSHLETPPSEDVAILYVGARLPELSETFVYRELLNLRRRGRRVTDCQRAAPRSFPDDALLTALSEEALVIYSLATIVAVPLALLAIRAWRPRGGRCNPRRPQKPVRPDQTCRAGRNGNRCGLARAAARHRPCSRPYGKRADDGRAL